MREILADVERFLGEGKQVAVATVVSVWGSAPRRPGSRMAVSSAGDVAGSVSGGCVEGAVFEEARGVIETGEPRLVSFGVSDDDAWEVGLSCGGEISVFIEKSPLGPPFAKGGKAEGEEDEAARVHSELVRAIHEDRLVALATVIAGDGLGRQMVISPGGETVGELGGAAGSEARERGAEVFRTFEAVRFSADGREVFLEAHPPRPKLVLVGAVHTAIPLVTFAKELGFVTYVIDPRRVFATPERFGHADRLIHAWPQEVLPEIGLTEGTYLALLSHDPKIDLPAVELALRSPCRYIGALGSKKTHGKRVQALRERGFSDEEIDRIRAPIGIDLGGRRPEEIAVSVMAEIVAASHGAR